MSRDIKGYYALLEVQYDASAHEIKASYRRLAKIYHPDAKSCMDSGLKFRAITEAYAILIDADARAAYDSASVTETDRRDNQSDRKPIDPITCYSCKQVTAQPRYIAFRYVISVVFATFRNPVQGIYCSSCAKKAAWRASAITAFAGWWGFPWGPIYTISEGIKNAFGGTTDTRNNESLLWHNALAFASRGDMKLAFALAERVSRSPITDMSERAEDFLKFLKSHGADYSDAKLTDPWQGGRLTSLGQIALVAMLPLAFGIAISMADSPKTTADMRNTAATAENYLPTAPSSQIYSQAASDPNLPTCKRSLQNGERLAGSLPQKKSGHIVEIDNGSGGDAIVKIRRWPSQKLAVSFLVSNNQKASIEGIPDGEYTIQYAFGRNIAADCKSFTALTAAGEFPRAGELLTTREDVADGVIIGHQRLSYTLYSVPAGNVRPQSIDASAFNAE